MTAETVFEREALPQLGALHSFALRLCGNEQYSRDLVQETMLKACKYFRGYEAGTNCKAWLFQICKNSYFNEYRRSRYEPMSVDFQNEEKSDERMFQIPLVDNTVGEHHSAFFGDEVTSSLESIPEDYQTAVLLSDVEGYTYEEIAEFMRVPIGTIRSRIHRGRKMLAGRLSGYARRHGYGSTLME